MPGDGQESVGGSAPDGASSGTKTLVFIVGPAAVGKMTVGRELSRLSGLPLFHNHLSIEAVLPVFDFGEPAFNRLVGQLRRGVIEEVAKSDRPGVIFTYMWAFDDPGDRRYVESLRTGTSPSNRTSFWTIPTSVRRRRPSASCSGSGCRGRTVRTSRGRNGGPRPRSAWATSS